MLRNLAQLVNCDDLEFTYDRSGGFEKKIFHFFLFAVKCTLKTNLLHRSLHLHIVRSCHLKDKLLYDTDQFCNFSASLHTMARDRDIKT